MNRGVSGPERSKGMGGPMEKGMTGIPVVKPKNSMEALKRLWGYLREQRWPLFLVFFLVLASSGFALMGPLLIGKAIDSMGITTGQVQFPLLAKIVGSLIIVYILGALASWLQTYLMASVSQKTVKSMRKDIFDKVQTLPLRFFDERPRGDLMSRLTNDVENINNTLSQATTQIFSSLITVIGAVGMMLMLSPSLTLVSLIVVPLGLFITKKIAERTRKLFLEQQTELGQLNGYIEEMISGQRVVKAFNREQETIDQFAEKNQRLKKVGAQAQVFSGIIPPLMNAINNVSFALVAGIGGYMAVQGAITIGIITAFLNYSKQFARPLNEMANQFNMLQSAFAGAERVFEVLDEEPEFADQTVARSLGQVEGKVEFKDVTFGYKSDKPVLQAINLTAEPGQMIALVGPTGSGKTTIVNLLMRFYDVQKGSVIVDGQDIRQIEKEDLRSSIGMVLQDTYLFAGTVMENIRYGKLDATDEQVMYAARMANAHSFIERLPDGYHTKLTEDASNISQGQRQLLTIARAILADPSILILDEATSSIDTRTEMQIQKALKVLMQGRTSFVIAHRLSTIQEADQILVINQGEIMERGSHQELLEQKGFYYNLYHTQFKNQAS
ncbi:ABC transporter ATP-binding protein [Brevibacillus laterosporus]|uniref:ABC transporter ATP-binding protein n=1 Tax=Brevibacillus laterosporus TaxID=1465 RepID=UPI000366E1FA|nr:ABC transporter ATP-binding protein [Brevibacillus laterosporus]ATO49668.1 multidrug ABC transporter ATP-binding protein [Brevibacillus laterosporus DSM 25]MBG9801049.1 multidrug ABC transporter ATP-binding protein [Brevibacillus laterosporus]MED2003232.1 ABC transporter ATP-binding protein [Brevibacillus laterosporus]MED4765310.1 ABC transporter ATP-binding protein [Brevibacillus laterosporus]TPH10994.1 ABC transporter ATP-binding protein [Brevibacillus laterosporus]